MTQGIFFFEVNCTLEHYSYLTEIEKKNAKTKLCFLYSSETLEELQALPHCSQNHSTVITRRKEHRQVLASQSTQI